MDGCNRQSFLLVAWWHHEGNMCTYISSYQHLQWNACCVVQGRLCILQQTHIQICFQFYFSFILFCSWCLTHRYLQFVLTVIYIQFTFLQNSQYFIHDYAIIVFHRNMWTISSHLGHVGVAAPSSTITTLDLWICRIRRNWYFFICILCQWCDLVTLNNWDDHVLFLLWDHVYFLLIVWTTRWNVGGIPVVKWCWWSRSADTVELNLMLLTCCGEIWIL